MAITAQEVAADALYESGIVARDMETPSASQIKDAIKQINYILSQEATNLGLNPYYDTYHFTAVIGEEKNFIPNLIQPETVTYTQASNNIRYPMEWLPRDKYFGSGRLNNIETYPTMWFSEPGFGGATLYVYPLPNVAYNFEIHAKFRLQMVTQFQDLSLTLEKEFIDYITHRCAQRMCAIQGFPLPDNIKALITESESYLKSLMAPPDYSLKRHSTLGRSRRGIPNPALSQMFDGWFPA